MHEPVVDGPSPPARGALLILEQRTDIGIGSSSDGGHGSRCGGHSGHDSGSGGGWSVNDVVAVVVVDDDDSDLLLLSRSERWQTSGRAIEVMVGNIFQRHGRTVAVLGKVAVDGHCCC